ncbi:Fructosamine kinase-domain-containing protein [Plectosphaerella plurivora]|uniref:protein-ribulosamine 3-kinase n=1 Tax=Plectosphaerella plurivora TaxID=936078 RepID=A0A9P8V5P0_9PEZI|nr:Fructosamine kinase-domain-containing protein [Plectosphaerella plurivora]
MAATAGHDQLMRDVAAQSLTLGGGVTIDDAIRQALPEGTRPVDAHSFGQSAWSSSAKINAVDRDGLPVAYFLKYVPGDLGRDQLRGEFMGMEALHRAAPGLVPKPIGWGKLNTVVPPSHFLLIEFREFIPNRLPDPVRLGARVAAMHKSPAARSPTGMFGFPVQTFDGARLQAVDWDPSWTSFFGKLLAKAYELDTETNGTWPELDAVYQQVQAHVVPRLIGALESEGRKVEPVLVHGNMWDGNVGTEASTGDPWIFDCATYYGHNEMELGIWRAERHQLKAKAYRREYLRNHEASEPEDEWDDRNRLYSAKTNFMHSACYAGSPARHLAYNDFGYLLNKYGAVGDVRQNFGAVGSEEPAAPVGVWGPPHTTEAVEL